MLLFVFNGFSLIGVLGFLVRSLEVVLRRVLIRLHLANVAPRVLAGAYGAEKAR